MLPLRLSKAAETAFAVRLSTILPFIVVDVARHYKMTQQSTSPYRAKLIDHFIHDNAYKVNNFSTRN